MKKIFSRKKSRPTGSIHSLKRALNTTIISKSRLATGKVGVGFLLFLYLPLILLSFMDSSIWVYFTNPLVLSAWLFSLMIYFLGVSLRTEIEALIEEEGKPDQEQQQIVGNPEEIKELRKTIDKQIRKNKSKIIYLAPLLLYLIIITPFLLFYWYQEFTTGSYSLMKVVAEVIFYFYWSVTPAAFLSGWRIVRILKAYIIAFFREDTPILLLEFQKDIFSKYLSSDLSLESTKRSYSFDYGLSHYSFYNIASSLVRRSRALLIIFLAFLVETIFFIWAFGFQSQYTNPPLLGLNVIFIFFILIMIIFYSVLDYFDTEWALHRILSRSKRNLIAFYDGALQKFGIMMLSSHKDDKNDIPLGKRIEISERLLSNSKQLPTWTFDAKIAGGITVTIIIQIILLALNIINNVIRIG